MIIKTNEITAIKLAVPVCATGVHGDISALRKVYNTLSCLAI